MKTEDRITLILFGLMEGMIDLIALLFCLLFLLLGLYSLTDTVMLYRDASDSSILRFRPESTEQISTMYEELKGSVSWLVLEGAGVDDPIMQGEDNMEYLNKNPYGEFSLSGSLFLDCRNSADFSDPYSLIYGHHMDHNMMFGALDQYMDEDFFFSHPDGLLYVKDEVHKLEIVAAAQCSAYDQSVFEPGEAEAVKEFIQNHSTHLRECSLDGRILCMSTCRFPDTQSRTVVFALIKDTERSPA